MTSLDISTWLITCDNATTTGAAISATITEPPIDPQDLQGPPIRTAGIPIGAAAALVAVTTHKAGMEARGTSIPALISMRTVLSMALATHGVSVVFREPFWPELSWRPRQTMAAVATVEAVVEVVTPPMVPAPGTTSPIKLILVILTLTRAATAEVEAIHPPRAIIISPLLSTRTMLIEMRNIRCLIHFLTAMTAITRQLLPPWQARLSPRGLHPR
jgi:hypothetical protein